MTRRGFRKARSRGPGAGGGSEAGEGFLSASLFSQAQILHLMRSEFARSRRYGLPLGCIMLQVDRLTQLVDLHGAELRSTVRQALATLVKQRTRGSDLLGAVNDDRYLLVLPHTDLERTRLVAERLREHFEELEVEVDGKPLVLTLSLGVTACEQQKTLFFDSLVGQAEMALEQASRSGGNKVASFTEASFLAPEDRPPGEPHP